MDEDHLRVMFRQEATPYFCPDYLTPVSNNEHNNNENNEDADDQQYLLAEMNEVWRRKICEWAYKVVDHFQFDREVVSICLNFLDRFIAYQQPSSGEERRGNDQEIAIKIQQQSQDKQQLGSDKNSWNCNELMDSKAFQLAAMTALFLSLKLHAETTNGCIIKRRKKLNLNFFVDLSRGQFTDEQLLSMEQIMLGTLSWRVNPPTPMAFVGYMLRLLPIECIEKRGKIALKENNNNSSDIQHEYTTTSVVDDRVVHVLYELSRYLTELSVCVYSLSVQHLPSTVAFAAILISMDMIDPRALSYEARDTLLERMSAICPALRHNTPDIQDVTWQIHAICPEIGDYSVTDFAHPISIARDAGFLVPPRNKKKHDDSSYHHCDPKDQESPVSVVKKKGTKRPSRIHRRKEIKWPLDNTNHANSPQGGNLQC